MIIETLLFLVIFSLGAGLGGAVIYFMFQTGLLEIDEKDNNGNTPRMV
jgi:hypothetical protein